MVGPTAIGKTKLAVQLANYFQTEIVSADSRQFFKEMKIGTAVPSPEELAQAKHHFIQHKSIHDRYSVGDFERDALALLNDLFKQNEVVILVGGSGLYVDAVVKGLDNFPDVDLSIRETLNERLKSEGLKSLQKELKQKDFNYYQKVDLENSRRIIRALEISSGTGKPYSSFLDKKKKARAFKSYYLGISADREIIYSRINQRVDNMIEEGLVVEAQRLLPSKNLNALQTVGYKELFEHFKGNRTLSEAIEEIKKNTRRFAKRQLTWYRKNEAILWVDFQDDFKTILEKLKAVHV